MGFTIPVSPSINQLVGDGSGGSYDWDVQVRDNLLAVQRVLARDATEQEVINTTTPTTVFTTSVAGGTLGTTGAIRLTLIGRITNNTGVTQNLTLTGTYGGTTVFTTVIGVTTNANGRAINVVAVIIAANATNAQRCHTVMHVSGVDAGTGGLQVNDFTLSGRHDSMAVDSTAAQTLAVSITHGTASTNMSFFMRGALVETLPV